MGSAFKYALICFSANLLAALLIYLFFVNDSGFLLIVLAFIWSISLLIQLIIAIAYLAGTHEKNKNIGKGILLALGVIFVIGLSLCGGVANFR